MTKSISFGTSGHRGIINDSFTAGQVRAICQAIATFLKQDIAQPSILIGYDPREGNDAQMTPGSFTEIAASTFKNQGCVALICTEPTPTPVISWAIPEMAADGGIILTASHNPPEYNGLKFNPKNGAPAPVEITTEIESLANTYLTNPPANSTSEGRITRITPAPDFAKSTLNNLMSLFPETDLSTLCIGIEAKHGTAGKTWQHIGELTGLNYGLLHSEPRSDFGGLETNPTKIDQLQELIGEIKDAGLDMGVAHDPDTDRHVLLDETGSPLTPEETTAILGRFFHDQGLPIEHYITTLASSRLIKVLADTQQATFVETPVGFKYFAEPLEAARSVGKRAFAVESSGGFSTSFHTLEKCGFYPALLMLICLQHTEKTLSQLKKELYAWLGEPHFTESEFHFKDTDKASLKTFFQSATVNDLIPHTDIPIQSIDQRDGLKLNFESGDWLLLRLSGTEPLARIYAESDTLAASQALISLGQRLIGDVCAN